MQVIYQPYAVPVLAHDLAEAIQTLNHTLQNIGIGMLVFGFLFLILGLFHAGLMDTLAIQVHSIEDAVWAWGEDDSD